MALAGIPLWNDQDVVLFHGTVDVHVSSIVNGVDLRRCQPLRDFGRGFYTTTNPQQARRWANDLAFQSGGSPAVIAFTVERNALAQLESLFFIRGSPGAVDYWSFVRYCRTTVGDHHRAHTGWYDVVAGPVTGSWPKQTLIPDADQISFHTVQAVLVLDGCRKAEVV